MKTIRAARFGIMAAYLSLLALNFESARGQDLRSEADALEDLNDLPKDDLDGMLKEGAAEAPKAKLEPTESVDPIDQLPAESPTKTIEGPDSAELDDENEDSSTTVPDALQATPGDALTGAAQEATGKITKLGFKQYDDRVRLHIEADRPLDFEKDLRTQRRQVVLEIKNVGIARSILKRALDTGEFDGPVAYIQAFESKVGSVPVTKVLFQLRTVIDPSVLRTGNDLYVDFPIRKKTNALAGDSGLPETFTGITKETEFKGTRISLNVKDADLRDILNLISKASGRNFILGSAEAGKTKVTLGVRNTPWDQVLSIVLLNAGLGYQSVNGTYRIMTLGALKDEIDTAAKTSQAAETLIGLETRLVPLSYAKASDVSSNLKDFLSGRGKVSVDTRSNSIVVTDIPLRIEKVLRYIKAVDKQTSQVLIEARIVEAQRSFSKSLKSNFSLPNVNLTDSNGLGVTGSIDVGDVTAASGSSTSSTSSGTGTTTGGTSTTTSSAAAKTGGTLQFNLNRLGNFGPIAAYLNMVEKEEKVKVIASPRVVVSNNKTAKITQGNEIQISVTQADGVSSSQTKKIELALEVTPQISADGFVSMKIDLKRDIPKGNSGNAETRQATSEMLVESGKTAVLGGVYSSDSVDGVQGWPFFRSLPILGALFRDSTSNTIENRELLMFISPRILNTDRALFTDEDRALGENTEGGDGASAGPEQVF